MDRISKLKDSRRTQSAAGIHNSAGQYNCFLNVVVQSLWHLTSFQDAFSTFPEHSHTSEKSSCVLCALFMIFEEYRTATGSNLSPVDLRQALSEAFVAQDRFQEGVMADAGECYIELVQLISRLLPTEEARTRLARNLFDLVMVDRIVCSKCDYDGEQTPTSMNTVLVYVTWLVETAKVLGEKPLDELLGAMSQQDDIRCPKCSASEAIVAKQVRSLPNVFTISTVWPSSRPSRTLLNDFLNTISVQIDLQSLGAVDMKLKKAQNPTYHLRGMILYYGRHYTACFYHASVGRWLRFDDSRVDPIGRYWHEVTDFCVRSRFQPSVLFYERESDGQVYYESVPQDVIPRPLSIMDSPKRPTAERYKGTIPAAPVCPSLEGPVYRKNKKQWSLSWFKLSNWTVALYSRAQKVFSRQHGGWVQSQRDPPLLLIPVITITSIEHDSAPHNFNRKPHYLKILAKGDNSSSTPTAPSSDSIEVLLFVEGEGPFAQILSALIQAKEVLQKASVGEERPRSVIIDNGSFRSGGSPTSDVNALDFAPNASMDDLRRIAEMESGTVRDNSDEDDFPTTVIGSPVPPQSPRSATSQGYETDPRTTSNQNGSSFTRSTLTQPTSPQEPYNPFNG